MTTNITYSIDTHGLVTWISRGNIYAEMWCVNSSAVSLFKSGGLVSQIEPSQAYAGMRSMSSDDQLSAFRQALLRPKAAKKAAAAANVRSRGNHSDGYSVLGGGNLKSSSAHSYRKFISKLT